MLKYVIHKVQDKRIGTAVTTTAVLGSSQSDWTRESYRQFKMKKISIGTSRDSIFRLYDNYLNNFTTVNFYLLNLTTVKTKTMEICV